MKKYKEKGERDPFNWSSNPHSIGFALSVESLVKGGVKPKKRINVIITIVRVHAVISTSQNIWVAPYAGTPSGTPTLLRLISPFGESDGRFVHALELNSE